MPAKSEAQRRLFAIAEHHPEQLYAKNKRILGDMSHQQMHDFASTKTTERVEKAKQVRKK